MKKSYFIFLVAFLVMGTSANAQFFKKLKKKVQERVEEVISDNVADKAANEADNALNNVWEMKLDSLNLGGMGSAIDPSKIPDSYDFNWKYNISMQLQDGKNMDFVYRLKKGAKYMGMELPKMSNMFMVMDHKNEMMVMYINNMVRATKMPQEEAELDNPYSDMEYEKIGSKEILGYNCDGFKSENKDYVFTMYITEEAGVGFSSLYKSQKNLPKGFNPDWISEDSLLMEMQMDDKNDPEKSLTMVCTGLSKENFTISK